MARFTFEELATITRGRWIVAPDTPGDVAGVSTDSRTLRPGAMFVALRGERFDGHELADQAAAAGATALIVQKHVRTELPTLLVSNTLQAYQQLAGAHRRRFPDLQVVGITGSCGKTSVKEILGAILRVAWGDAVLVTPGNANTQIGVPQTLLGLTRTHVAAVVEMGVSLPGELAILTDLVGPRVAVLTHIGPAHLEGLGDLNGVAREKASLLSGLGPGGTAVLPAGLVAHPLLEPHLPRHVVTVSLEAEAAVTIETLGGDLTGSRFRALRPGRPPLEIRWSLTGRHMALNAGLAIAVAGELSLSDEAICQGLGAAHLPGMRMEIIEHNDVTWINDAYNANPASSLALLDWLSELPKPSGREWLVLGDMAELGDQAAPLHSEVLTQAGLRLPHAVILVCGPLMARVAPSAVERFASLPELQRALRDRIRPGDRIALKGSRASGLDRLVPCDGRPVAGAGSRNSRPA